jgi:hypothetical protein
MRGFKLRKYRRLMYRAFPDLVRPTKRNYVSHEPTEDEKNAGTALMCLCLFILILFLVLAR